MPHTAKDDYNSQGYSTDGHCQVLLIWLYLQQAEQILFQHQDSTYRRIIRAQKNPHRNGTENTFPVRYFVKRKLFNYLNTHSFPTSLKKKQLAAVYSSKYNSTSYCLEQLWVYSEVLHRACISLSFEMPRVSLMSPYRALTKL